MSRKSNPSPVNPPVYLPPSSYVGKQIHITTWSHPSDIRWRIARYSDMRHAFTLQSTVSGFTSEVCASWLLNRLRRHELTLL